MMLIGGLSILFTMKALGQVGDSLPAQRAKIRFQLLEEVTFRHLNLLNGKSVTPAQTLKGTALRQVNSLTVADAVRYFSGVQLKDYGGIGGLKTIDTRSMGTNHTIVFYDGIQLGNAQNGQVDLGRLSLDNLEEITIYNGHKGEIFQPAKSFSGGASIYLQSKAGEFRANERSHLKANFKTGSFGLINPSVRWEQQIAKRVSGSLSAEYLRADGKYKFRYTNGTYDTTATRKNGDIAAFRVEGDLHGSGVDSSSWNVKAYLYDSQRGLPGAVVANKFENGQRQWDRNFFIQGKYQSSPSKRFGYMFNARYARDYLRYYDAAYITSSGALDNRYTQSETYLSIAIRYRLRPWWDLAAAVDLQLNDLDANIYRFAFPSRSTLLGSLSSELRVDELIIQGGLLETAAWNTTRDQQAEADESALAPFFSASWQPNRNYPFRLHAFYKKNVRLPTFNDLYYTFIGNTLLEPEYSNQYDLGFAWAHQFEGWFRYLSFQADGYYNSVTNKIVAIPTTNLYRWMMLNLGRVEVRGIDLVLEGSMLTGTGLSIRPALKYTWQEAIDLTPQTPNHGQQIPYVPKHNGSLIINAALRKYYFNYSFIYTGERYSQKTNDPVNLLQPWYTHDLSLSRDILWKKYNCKVAVEVNNIFNQYYDVVANFPMPGRYYRISIGIQY